MSVESAFSSAPAYRPTQVVEYRGVRMPAAFGDERAEVERTCERGAWFDRSDRGLVRVTGRDRKPWLHNLLTNAIKMLEPMRGCYAFAIDVRGRVQFDLNVLDLAEAIWLDIDLLAVPGSLAHLNRYLISEDAQLSDVTSEFARLAIAGPQARSAAAALGVEPAADMGDLSSAWLDAEPGRALLVRHDFAGLPGFELVVQRSAAAAWWEFVLDRSGLQPAGLRALDVLRIDAGIPWLGRDIDEKVIPPETGQVERGIHYSKGCYLGQEVIERMRSHGSLARRLVKLRIEDGAGLVLPIDLKREGQSVGRLTSLARDPRNGQWLGLGYLRTTLTDASGVVAGDPPRCVSLR